MASKETVILNKKEIAHKLKRIAYQIYEANISQEEVIIAGIKANGYIFAEKLKTAL
jgi:pyrimidine operon attenuation protein/uracil phosphoribosyltransferase